MSTIALTLSVTTVTLADGRAALTASVTNSSPVPARIVLGAFGPPDAAAPAGATAWTAIEQPVRDVEAGATVQYAVTFAPPAGTAAGSYPVRFIAYSADQAPEEYSDQAKQVDVVVPAAPVAPTPKKPWWPWAVAAALVVIVGVVLFFVFRPTDDGPPPPSPTPTPSPSESSPPPSIDTSPPVDHTAALTAHAWVVIALDDGSGLVATLTDTKPTAVFGTSGTVSGSGGCNSYSASYSLSGDQITVGPATSTLIACIGTGVMEQEQRFFKALESARTFTLESGALQLRKADGTTAALLVEVMTPPTITDPVFTFHPDVTINPDFTFDPQITRFLPPDVIFNPLPDQP